MANSIIIHSKIDPQIEKEPSGCTAVATLVSDDCSIYCANAGDSRAVLCDAGVAEPLSFDHKPVNPGMLIAEKIPLDQSAVFLTSPHLSFFR